MDFRRTLLCSDTSEFLTKVESLKNSLAASQDIFGPKVIFTHLIANKITEWHLEVEALSEIVSLVASTNSRSTRSNVDVFSRITEILQNYQARGTLHTFDLLTAEVSAGDRWEVTNSFVLDLHKLIEYISTVHQNYPQDRSIKTVPLLLDTIISAIRLSGKEIFSRESRREIERQSSVNPSIARAPVAAPRARAVQVVASAESEQAAGTANAAADTASTAAAPDAAPAAQSDIPSFLGEI